MTLLSAYNVTHIRHVSDILSMYTIHSWIHLDCMYFIFFLTVISHSLPLSKKVLPQHSNIGAIVVNRSCIPRTGFLLLSHSQTRTVLCFRSCSHLFVSDILVFHDATFIGNSVGTELVVIENAYAPQSYREILDRRIKVVFNKMLPEYEKFRDSPKESDEWKLFQNKVFFDLQPEAVLSFKEPIVNQKLSLAGRRLLTDAVGLAILTMAGSTYPDLRLLSTKDPQAKRYTNVFVSNKRSNPALNAITSKT